jgi:hypothetical protein
VRLQFDSLDDDQKAMMRMLRDTCLKESGADEGKWPSVYSTFHIPFLVRVFQLFLK